MEPIKQKAIYFTDGSCKGNPGYAGYGVYGYHYQLSDKPKNIKHPIHGTLYYTTTGVNKEKDTINIEVTRVIEIIHAINNYKSTNNEAELLAVVTAFEKASQIENLSELTIYTDSNYIVSSFNENLEIWKQNNWKRIDHKPIVHIKEWTIIDNFKKEFTEKDIKINVEWVKGHSDIHGNNIADMFSVAGSNSARRQLNSKSSEFNSVILDSDLPYSEYKKSFIEKDILFFFRDLYFSSDKLNDTNYCFLSTSDNPNTLGKRDTSSIFISNIGYVPEIVNKFKSLYRSIERNYITTCCIKLNKFDNKELLRLAHLINIEDILVKNVSGRKTTYNLIKDTTPFMFENSVEYPFIINASKLFNKMLDVSNSDKSETDNLIVKDITDRIVSDGKIVLSNKDKSVDFTDVIGNSVKLKQKLLVTVGYDIPNYLALKNIEKKIEKVYLILETKPDNNFCTLFINILMSDRNIYSVNIENKFLKLNHLS